MEPNSLIKYLSIRRFVDCSVMLEISLNNSFTGGSNLHLVMIISWRQINQLYDIFEVELEFTVFPFKCCLFSIEFFLIIYFLRLFVFWIVVWSILAKNVFRHFTSAHSLEILIRATLHNTFFLRRKPFFI